MGHPFCMVNLTIAAEDFSLYWNGQCKNDRFSHSDSCCLWYGKLTTDAECRLFYTDEIGGTLAPLTNLDNDLPATFSLTKEIECLWA